MPSGVQKVKQEWRKWHEGILKELDGQYAGDEKMFGKSVLHITSRDQQNRYELAAKILGNDIGKQVLADRNLQEYIGFDTSAVSSHDRNKQMQKELKQKKYRK